MLSHPDLTMTSSYYFFIKINQINTRPGEWKEKKHFFPERLVVEATGIALAIWTVIIVGSVITIWVSVSILKTSTIHKLDISVNSNVQPASIFPFNDRECATVSTISSAAL